MPVTNRIAQATGWDSVAGGPGASTPVPGATPGMFGDGANETLDRYMALINMGMTPEQATAAVNDPAALSALSGAPEASGLDPSVRDYGTRDAEAYQEQIEAQYRLTPEQQAIEDRFGNDMAWLDPAFQRQAATVRPTTTADAAQFGVTADPAALARQEGLLDSVLGRGTTADATTETAQRGFLSELDGRGTTADPRAEAAQYDLLGELEGRGRTSDADSEEAQRSALDELFGLYRQGGQGAQDRAARARNRADTENWLQGQRQADIQDRAERGMSGSGGEILDLLADRQAAASRLSAGDLEADAAAEKRAMDALLAGTDLATGMRSASDEYEASNTRTRADVANQARSAADAYQGALDQVRGSTMEGMRSAADQFSVNNDRTASDLATSMRDASDRFVGDNADRIGDASEFNAKMINDATSETKQFLQDAYLDTMRRRDAWDRDVLGLQTDVATGTRSFDAGQNTQGFDWGTDVADTDVANRNNAQTNANTSGLSMWTGSAPQVFGASQGRNNAVAGEGAALGELGLSMAETMASMGAGGGMGGGASAMGGSGGSQNQKLPWDQW